MAVILILAVIILPIYYILKDREFARIEKMHDDLLERYGLPIRCPSYFYLSGYPYMPHYDLWTHVWIEKVNLSMLFIVNNDFTSAI